MAWDKFQKEAEKIEVRDPQTAKAKMQKLQLAMNLRRRLRERFHTRGVDTPDYTKWIAKVESDTRQLADALLSKSSHVGPYSRLLAWCAVAVPTYHLAGWSVDW